MKIVVRLLFLVLPLLLVLSCAKGKKLDSSLYIPVTNDTVGKNIAGSPYLFLIARGNASNIQVFQKNFTKKEFGLGILSRDFNNTVGLFYWFDLLQKQFKNVESLQFIKQYSIESATNPYDIAYVDSQKAYVSRNDAKELLAIHPLTGSFIKKIALPADNDGYSEMSGLYLNENKLWIQLQMLNRKKLKSAEEVGQIAILDTRLDQLARKPLLMKRKNPTSSFKSFGGNLYVLLKTKNLDEASLKDFVKKFRLENCTKDCNINLYDTKSIEKYIDIYPMPKPVYIEYADHFIALSSFDSPATVWLYPYQDMKYKEFSGKNWKKEPIK
jgi:hypothetical protein